VLLDTGPAITTMLKWRDYVTSQ